MTVLMRLVFSFFAFVTLSVFLFSFMLLHLFHVGVICLLQDGGVFWTKGQLEVQGGTYTDNEAEDRAGVIIVAEEGSAIVTGGQFVVR